MSNDPSSGGDQQQPAWQGQQPYPGAYGQQPGDQTAYPGSYSPPTGQQAGAYGQHGAYAQTQSWSPPRGQTPPGWQGAPAGAGPGGVEPPGQARGTFAALFDFGFNSFATPVVIKVLYVLGLVVIGLGYAAFVIAGFAQSPGYGLGVLVFGAVVALFYVIFFRVFLEFYYAVVRMSEDIRAMRDR
jgi:hypothetical protein